MDNQEIYKPCPCGSGKKYKFCCYTKQRESSGADSFLRVLPPEDDDVLEEWEMFDEQTLDESRLACDKGLALMEKGDLRRAIPHFRKALSQTTVVYTPANNLALCLYATGELDEAITVQEQSFENSSLPNPFGLANLATFLWIRGDEEGAKDCIEEALAVPLPSADACIKVCEVLSRFRQHERILKTAADSGYESDPGVCFFTGVAAANLGKKKRAIADLKRVDLGHHKADMAKCYLDCLHQGTSPETLMGDWPYLRTYEVCPWALLNSELEINEEEWRRRRILVQFVETGINEEPLAAADLTELLTLSTHPDAKKLLQSIVDGDFGPDELRMSALRVLTERGDLQDEDVEVLVGGRRKTVKSAGINLNPNIRFGGKLPRKLETIYKKAIKNSQKPNPDWERVGKLYQQVLRALPEFYPARYNYATTLMYRHRYDEAEAILKELNRQYPEYLFASGTLLQLYLSQGRDVEAEAFFLSFKLPSETHPSAMASWLAVQYLYWDNKGEDKAATQCLDMLRELNPDHPYLR